MRFTKDTVFPSFTASGIRVPLPKIPRVNQKREKEKTIYHYQNRASYFMHLNEGGNVKVFICCKQVTVIDAEPKLNEDKQFRFKSVQQHS